MKTKNKKLASLFLTLIVSCLMMISFSLCASADSAEKAVNTQEIAANAQPQYQAGEIDAAGQRILSGVKTVANIVGVLAIIALGILLLTGGSQALQKSKNMAIGVLIGLIVITFGVNIFNEVAGSSLTEAKLFLGMM